MSENEKVVQKRSWFAELKSEFRKIVWPDKKSLFRQTVAVVIVSVLLALVIAGIDYVVQLGLDILMKL